MYEWLENIDGKRYRINFVVAAKLLLKYLWLILLSTVFVGSAVFVYSEWFITPLYQSSIKMYVNNYADTSDSTSITSSDLTASQNLIDTYAVVLTSYPTLSAVIEQSGVSCSYEELCGMISTSSVNDTEVFQVTVTSANADEAAAIANTIAEVAPEEIMEVVTGSSVKIVEYARVATEKSSPDIKGNTVKGLLAGFVFACCAVLFASLLNNSQTVEEKIRHDFRTQTILSAIPLMDGDEKGKKSIGPVKAVGRRKSRTKGESAQLCDQLTFASAEAYRLLRTNLLFSFPDKSSCKILGVTSSVRSEGKTTTAINLSYVLAQTGKSICLIDCDFRLPSVAGRLHIDKKGAGMTNLFIGGHTGESLTYVCNYGDTTFYTIPSGTIPPNPTELLGSSRMQDALNVIGREFDYLILDLPPIGIVSDALVASRYLDGMIFVVREDLYTRRMLQDSLRAMEDVHTKLLGIVVTQSTALKKEYHRYGYQYGYGYGKESDRRSAQKTVRKTVQKTVRKSERNL